MKRRNFVILSGAGLAALSIPSACLQSGEPGYDPLLAEPGFLSYIWDDDTMIAIGKLYRAQVPEEGREADLLSVLLTKGTEHPVSPQQFLADRAKADYENNDLVMLDGWMLSRTEARQCALFSLIHTT
jgi:hypothetical protein